MILNPLATEELDESFKKPRLIKLPTTFLKVKAANSLPYFFLDEKKSLYNFVIDTVGHSYILFGPVLRQKSKP